MRSEPFALESSSPASDGQSVPFASEWVTLTRQAHIELVMHLHYFKTMHERAVARAAWREARYQSVLRQMKAQGEQREAALRGELESAHARIRDLQQRLFGSKTERRRATKGRAGSARYTPRVASGVARRVMAASCNQTCQRAMNSSNSKRRNAPSAAWR